MNLLINMIPFFLNIVLFPILLITGLIVCYRHRYKGGFYFFLIILIYKLLTFVNPYIIRKLMDSREYLQTGIYPYHISVLFSIFETLVIITAFCILIVSLYVKLTSRDIVSQFVEKVKKLVMNHKKIFYILSILLLAFIALLVFNTVSKDFSLISAEVKITENPSTTIGAISQPGEEPVLPERYLQYTFTIKNKTFRALGSARNFIQLDFFLPRNYLSPTKKYSMTTAVTAVPGIWKAGTPANSPCCTASAMN